MILITQPRVGTSYNETISLHYAARELGWDVLPAPFGWRLDDDLIKSGVKGVPYGSQTFCEVIAQQMGWTLKANSFDWLAKVPSKFLKRQVDFMTLGQAKMLTRRKFIKPADDKCFDAKVYDVGEFNPHEIISNDYPVLVSDVVEWTHEYRCFVLNNKAVTESCYILNGEIANPKNFDYQIPNRRSASSFVNLLLENYSSENSVIDVGIIKEEGAETNKGWAVIETNQAWASGLYGCDPMAALKVMAQAVE